MLWPDFIIPPPMEYCLRFINVWPEHSNTLLYPFYALLSISSLIFQLYDTTIVYQDLELLTVNITNLILVFTCFMKITIFFRQRWYVKNVLTEMMDDWNDIKTPEEANILNNYVQFSKKFLATTIVAYNLTMFLFLIPVIKSYFSESIENRFFPIQATFPFSNKISPNYEIISLFQSILILLTGMGYCITDSSYVAMALHATTKHEILRLTVYDLLKTDSKSTDRFSIKNLIQKHLNAIKFSKKIEKIFSGQLFIHFVLTIIQFGFLGFTYVMTFSGSTGINALLKNTFLLFAIFVELGAYCVIGEFLQTKSNSVAEAAYLLPWYNLKANDVKSMMMFIQRAQKPITITAGKILVVSHLTFIGIIKASVSYLSVLRAMRV